MTIDDSEDEDDSSRHSSEHSAPSPAPTTQPMASIEGAYPRPMPGTSGTFSSTPSTSTSHANMPAASNLVQQNQARQQIQGRVEALKQAGAPKVR